MSGRSEFIEKYFEVIKDLHARRLNVAMMDWRGQGLSERLLPIHQKGHITDFGAYKSDLVLFTEQFAIKKFKPPYILVTHSMGGVPALQLLGDGYDKFLCAVLCAPMTRIFPGNLHRKMIELLANAACTVGGATRSIPGVKEYSVEFKGNVLTSDEPRHSRFRELQAVAPNAIIREPTYGWLKAANDAMQDLHRPGRFEKLTTPIRIVSAANDQIVVSDDHETLANQSALIDRVVIADALHEILVERDVIRAQYWEAFDAFCEPKMQS